MSICFAFINSPTYPQPRPQTPDQPHQKHYRQPSQNKTSNTLDQYHTTHHGFLTTVSIPSRELNTIALIPFFFNSSTRSLKIWIIRCLPWPTSSSPNGLFQLYRHIQPSGIAASRSAFVIPIPPLMTKYCHNTNQHFNNYFQQSSALTLIPNTNYHIT